jgi:HEAT repeat protein
MWVVMPFLLVALCAALLPLQQTVSATASAAMKADVVRLVAAAEQLTALPASDLIARFKREPVFWRQFEIGRALAETGERTAIRELEPLLATDDRHLRGNAAFVLARLGDPRGFDAIAQILADRSERPEAQGIPGAPFSTQAQIRADRYHAAHLLGDLKDARGVPLLIPLLNDQDVAFIVPWSLAQIADPRAIRPLIQVLEGEDPSMRVLAISALEQMNAVEALPRLHELLLDNRRASFGDRTTVGEAARHAIAALSAR